MAALGRLRYRLTDLAKRLSVNEFYRIHAAHHQVRNTLAL
jgi:hypothetical protein